MRPEPAQAARIGFYGAVDTDPDAYAEARRVAKRTGVPVDTVFAMPQEIKRQDQMGSINFDTLAKTSPATAALLADVEKAKIAHDDVENMGMVETLFNSFKRGVPALQSLLPSLSVVNQSAGLNLYKQIDDRIAGGEDPKKVLGEFGGYGLTPLPWQSSEQALASWQSWKAKAVRNMHGNVGTAAADVARLQGERQAIPLPGVVDRTMAEKTWGGAFSQIASDPLRFIAAIGPESLVQTAPGLLAAIPAGIAAGPGGVAATIGSNSFLVDYASTLVEAMQSSGIDTTNPDAIRQGLKDPAVLAKITEQAGKHAVVVGAFDALSGGVAGKMMLPSRIAGKLASRPLAREMANIALQAPIQGVLGGAGELGGEIYAGQEIQPGNVLAEVFGEFFGTPAEVVTASAKRIHERTSRAQQADQTAEILGKLNELSAANKVLQRDADTFEAFVAHATENGPVQDVFINAQTLAQSGIAEQLAAVSPAVAEQLQTALDTGGDVRIPVAEYAARIAPTEYAQALLDHLKTNPEDFSRTEAQDYMQNHATELQAEVERVLADKQGDETFKASADTVKADIKTQLDTAARFTAPVNDAYASMVGNFFAVMAAKTGITPQEMFARYPLRVMAENVAGGQQFDQDGKIPLDIFDQVDTINIEPHAMSEQEKDDAQTAFLSTRPAGTAKYGRKSGIARRIRRASDNATNAIGEDPRIPRTVDSSLGAFSSYEVIGEVLPGDDQYNPGGVLKVRIYGKEQVAAGLIDEPALTFTVMRDGELSVNGPVPGGKTFEEFHKRGWAEQSMAGDQIAEGWSNLTTPDGKPLPIAQNIDLLGDVHARVRAWKMDELTGLHWSRATGAAAGLGDYGSAIYLQNKDEARGSFNPATLSIALLKGADLSTFLHESGHFFLEVTADLAAQPNAPATVQQDMGALLDWFGVKSIEEWNALDFEEKRSYHEQFARGFESYLFEGKAPSIELQGLFQRFRAWMLNVYRDLKALNVELTPEVRGVFDRMLASTEQIQLAEQGRSMMPLFNSATQAGMTPEEFAAYQALGVDATNEAIEDLQGRGLRDMQWLHNARGRLIKQLQKESAAKRGEVQMEVRTEVMSQPTYRAWTFLTAKVAADDKIEPAERAKSDPNTVDESQDSLFVAIAKLGGISKEAAISAWGVDPADKPTSGVFGKPVWRVEGGLSLDGMAEALSNYGYLDLDEHGKWDLRNLETKFRDELSGSEQHSVSYDHGAQQDPGRAGDQLANLEGLNYGRIDRTSLANMGLPQEVIDRLDTLRMLKKDALHPDLVAELFGFTSGDELVRKLAVAENPKAEIDALIDQRMLERFGDLSSQQAIEKAADKAIHNDVRARMVATEANALAKATGGRKVFTSAAKEFAAAMIARLKVRNIKPGQYASAEVRAAKGAEKASKSGDLATAAAEKRNQLINTYATRAAYDAQEEVDKGVRYLKRFDSAATRKGLDADYTDQIDALLERFDLRKGQSGKAIDKRAALAEWLTSQREAGFEPSIPPALENEAFRKSYKDLTVEEFRGVLDTVKQIEHLGRLKHRLLTARDQRSYEAVRDLIAASVEEHAGNRTADTRTPTTNTGRAVQGLKRFWASHIKAATWARVMDGGKDGGPMWEYFVRSANERGDMETTMRAEATNTLAQILKPVFALGRMGGKGQFFPSIGRSLNRESRLAIALNVGNAGNYQRLLGGEGWTIQRLAPVLQSLTAQEWLAVQSVWDHFESYRPQIAEKERRIYGKEPEWVTPTPFAVTTADGQTVQMRGGYYPIKYDPAASQRAEEHNDAEAAKRQLQGAYTTATTRRSFTKSRVEEVAGRPLLYTVSGLYSGVNDVIHDLAWHEWLIDANRLLRSKTIDGAIRDHYGPEAKQQFKTWIQDVAEGEKGVDAAVDLALSRLRQGVSAAGLGFNVMSALIQPLGITQSIVRVGAPWIGRGVAKYLAGPIGLTRQVNELSSFMENRQRTRFRELNELRNKVQGETAAGEAIKAGTYFLMMRCQQMVDVPTWWGAYEKAIAEGNEESHAVSLADQAVIDSQGGGQTKDLSAIERGGPAQKLFTVFYSFMNTALNLGVEKTMSANTPAKKAKLAVDYAMLYVVPAVLGYFLKAALTPGNSGDDDPEKLAKKLAANQIDYLMGLMVVVREFGEAAKTLTGANDFGRDYTGPAGLRLVADAVSLAKQAHQGEFDDAFRKAAINVVGDLFALPSAQLNRTITGAKALHEGQTDNPTALLFGYQKPR